MDLLDRLLGHDDWATARLLDLSRGLTDAQLDQPFDIGHRTLRDTLEHLICNIEFWTGVAAGQPPDLQRDDRSLATLAVRHERAYDAFAALARQKRDDERLDDTFVDRFGENVSFGGMILHVVLHNEGHRIEMLHIIQRLGRPDLPELELDHALWDLSVRLA